MRTLLVLLFLLCAGVANAAFGPAWLAATQRPALAGGATAPTVESVVELAPIISGTLVLCTNMTVSGSDACLVVGVGWYNNVTVTATYNGDAMTSVGKTSSGSSIHAEMFYLVNPDQGNTNTLLLTFSGAVFDICAVAVNLNNVDGTGPIGTYATNAVAADTTMAVTVNSVATDLVVDVFEDENAAFTFTLNDAGTIRGVSQNAGNEVGVRMSTLTGGAVTTQKKR